MRQAAEAPAAEAPAAEAPAAEAAAEEAPAAEATPADEAPNEGVSANEPAEGSVQDAPADGAEHAMTTRARAFARALERRFALPVTLADERYTSELAKQALSTSGRGGRADRHLRDQLAAQMILQAWFDGQHDA